MLGFVGLVRQTGMGRRVYSSRSAGYRMSNVKHQHQSRREMSGGRDKVVKHKGQANTEEQKTRSKMSLSLPLLCIFQGERTKVGYMRRKRGPEIHPGCRWFKLLLTHSGRDARGAKKNAGLVRWWQARREAEVWNMGRWQ